MEKFLEEQPEFYQIVPEFNSQGRLCNHGSGNEPKVKVMADEWERFNLLAGRQHEIIDGVVIYNETLEPCMPDNFEEKSIMEQDLEEIKEAIDFLLFNRS